MPSDNPDGDMRPTASPPGKLPAALEHVLLDAATAFGEQLEVEGLAGKLRETLSHLPDWCVAGISHYDEERETVTVYSFSHTSNRPGSTLPIEPIARHEDPIADSRLPDLAPATDVYSSSDLRPPHGFAVEKRLFENGARRFASAPLILQKRILGDVFLAFADPGEIHEDVLCFLERLARIVTPVLWNCHTHARFSLGDRRRDMLIELSDAINKSLRLQTVLDSARHAIQQLTGHCFSAINLLEKTGDAYLSYRTLWPAEGPHPDPAEPISVSLTGTTLEWILKHGETYQSRDLTQDLRFAHDAELRELGVRRYVATPLFVRGRVIGCLLMGSSDPRRTLGVDVWLYENIALQLALAVDNARQIEEVRRLSDRLAQQNVYLREEIHKEHDFSDMIGHTPAMRSVHEAIARVAGTSSTVMILGETGVGKELVARAIHAASRRAEHPMVKVNCAAIPEGMVESELFGHERGAFTSAVERRIGRFELACDGTLFLDEIGELSLPVQAKLLRVLQDGQFERVGGTETLTSNARIIAASNRNLLECVAQKSFRSDLYYRLNVFPIEIAPLRDRRDDIPLLVETFISQFNRRMGKHVRAISPAAIESLCSRDWPGNIRELRHVIERAMILCDADTLEIEGPANGTSEKAILNFTGPQPEMSGLADVEADHIRKALEHTGGVIEGPRGAAKLLGIKPSTLRFRMKRLGIRRSP